MFRGFIAIACLLTAVLADAKVERPPQFVLLAFDGSKNVNFWQTSRNFAAANNVRFTYFMSGTYFLTNADKNNYVEPRMGVGKSAIGFGGTVADMKPRLEQVRAAMAEGHEMASHANGHYDGAKYTEAQWNSEFAQFTDIMSSVWSRYNPGKEPAGWQNYFKNDVIGFRAPQLGVGNGLWKTLQNYDFIYDTSRVDKMNYWPQTINGVWNFPLAGLVISGSGKKTLSMDYNFYVADSKGVAGPSSEHKRYEDQMYNTYMNYFNNNYYSNRAPLHIGHHFSLWNGGAYWKAMQRFAKSVCGKPEVICGTYKELVAFVEANRGNIASYQKGDFNKLRGNGGMSFMATPPPQELTDEDIEQLRLEQHNHFNAHDEE